MRVFGETVSTRSSARLHTKRKGYDDNDTPTQKTFRASAPSSEAATQTLIENYGAQDRTRDIRPD
jgi:hypothetical protein